MSPWHMVLHRCAGAVELDAKRCDRVFLKARWSSRDSSRLRPMTPVVELPREIGPFLKCFPKTSRLGGNGGPDRHNTYFICALSL
jgi:hypothetical protein